MTEGTAVAVVSMTSLLMRALAKDYAVGYFEAWDQYSFEATLEAAEESSSPVILGFGAAMVDQVWLEGRGLEELAALGRCLAERATVPVALIFNEARTFTQVLRALRAGCNAVMLDSSHLSLDEHITVTRRVVEAAHALGATVEAELGQLSDASDPALVPVRTDPDLAGHFVERTNVDALAVSVGNTHLLSQGTASPDLELLARIHDNARLPLVIHGGTGYPNWAVRPAIETGVAKFNVGTRLKEAFLAGVRGGLAGYAEAPNVHRVVGSREATDILSLAKAAVKEQIVALMRLYGSAGQAGNQGGRQDAD